MKNKDTKALEFLYEQITKEDDLLLNEEKELARRYSEVAVPQFIKGIHRRVYNRGKIDFERMYEFLNISFDNFANIFGEDYPKVKDIYQTTIVLDICINLVYLRKNDDEITVNFHEAGWILNKNDYKEIKTIPIEKEEEIKDALTELIENSIIFRYKDILQPNSIYLKSSKDWAQWRKEKLKFVKLKQKLPEFEGIL